MMPPGVWATLVASAAAVDWWAAYVKHDGTLSQAMRCAFRTDTPGGRILFSVALTAGATWLHGHILTWPESGEK